MHDKILDRDLCDPIRDFLNCTQKGQKFRNFLIRSPNDWDRLCAALDAAEDAHLAIQAFLSTHFQIKHRPKEGFGALDDGQKYLYLYGVFQAVVVQQDAIEHIREIVATYCGGVAESSEGGVWYASCKCARDLRKYRNLCVGLPLSTKKKGWGTVIISQAVI